MFSVFFKKKYPRELKKRGTKEDVAGLKKLATAGDHLLFTEDSSEIISVEGCYKKPLIARLWYTKLHKTRLKICGNRSYGLIQIIINMYNSECLLTSANTVLSWFRGEFQPVLL